MPRKIVHRFQVPFLQVLDEKGKVDPRLDPGLPEEDLVRLYEAMVLAREADQRMLRLQRQGRIGTFGPATGQEAASVGPALAMGPRDWLVPSFREMGAMLMRGIPLSTILLYWGGWEEGNVFPEEARTLPIAVILASQLPHAVGLAYAERYRGGDAAVVAFFGDGSTSEGDFHEALNFAGAWKAPVVFVCQNNQWAISTPFEKQTAAETIAQKAIAYGVPGIRVDGNDPLATYVAVRDALARARAGEGPTLVEALTYRLMMHTTADDPTKYRDEKQVEPWQRRDPLVRTRLLLEKRKLWDEAREEELRARCRETIDAAVKAYETWKPPRPDVPFDRVYATPPAELEAQRREFLASLPGADAGKGVD